MIDEIIIFLGITLSLGLIVIVYMIYYKSKKLKGKKYDS